MSKLISIFGLILWFSAAPCLAQGEHSRRLSSELLVAHGDARALAKQPQMKSLHKKGLYDRLRGSLSGLKVLIRLADQEAKETRTDAQLVVGRLTTFLQGNSLDEFTKALSVLIKRYPLATNNILPAILTPVRNKQAIEIHQEYCAACHNEPDNDVERPAQNLTQQLKTMSQTEFVARMIIGVRGDPTTGLSNPLNDEEIAALVAYYQSR